MAKIPPPSKRKVQLEGLRIHGYTVGDWCPTPDGSGPSQAVAIALDVTLKPGVRCDLVLRLKSPAAVDAMIQSLLRHKRSVWPEAP